MRRRLNSLLNAFQHLKMSEATKSIHKIAQDYEDAEVARQVEEQYKTELNLDGYQKMVKIVEANAPGFYFTMSSVKRINYRPSSVYHTPLGVYAYPVNSEFFKNLVSNKLPFRANAKWIHIFHVDPDKILTLQDYTNADLAEDLEHLGSTFKLALKGKVKVPGVPQKEKLGLDIVEDLTSLQKIIDELKNKGSFEPEDSELLSESVSWLNKFEGNAGAAIWAITRTLARQDPKRWAGILFSLGYWGVDDLGLGIIHPNEPTQAVFFNQYAPEVKEGTFLNIIDSQLNLNYKYGDEGGETPDEDRALIRRIERVRENKNTFAAAKFLVDEENMDLFERQLMLGSQFTTFDWRSNKPSISLEKVISYIFNSRNKIKIIKFKYPDFEKDILKDLYPEGIKALLNNSNFPKELLFETFEEYLRYPSSSLIDNFFENYSFRMQYIESVGQERAAKNFEQVIKSKLLMIKNKKSMEDFAPVMWMIQTFIENFEASPELKLEVNQALLERAESINNDASRLSSIAKTILFLVDNNPSKAIEYLEKFPVPLNSKAESQFYIEFMKMPYDIKGLSQFEKEEMSKDIYGKVKQYLLKPETSIYTIIDIMDGGFNSSERVDFVKELYEIYPEKLIEMLGRLSKYDIPDEIIEVLPLDKIFIAEFSQGLSNQPDGYEKWRHIMYNFMNHIQFETIIHNPIIIETFKNLINRGNTRDTRILLDSPFLPSPKFKEFFLNILNTIPDLELKAKFSERLAYDLSILRGQSEYDRRFVLQKVIELEQELELEETSSKTGPEHDPYNLEQDPLGLKSKSTENI